MCSSMLRFSVALLLLLGCWQAVRADRGWKFDVTSKAQAMQQARAHGLGFDEEGFDQPDTLRSMFEDWCNTYGLASPSDRQAFQNFKANMREVRRINTDPDLPFWASGNPYSHLSAEEFSRGYMGAKAPGQNRRSALDTDATQTTASSLTNRKLMGKPVKSPRPSPSPTPSPLPSPAPVPCPAPCTRVNWVTQGKVTPVRNQGGCGSCWAFATVAAMESAYLLGGNGTASSVDLSEQQLVSCVNGVDSPYGGYGCGGGWVDAAFNYFTWGPVAKDGLYPYTSGNTGVTGTCNKAAIAPADSGNAVQASGSFSMVTPGSNEQALKDAVLAGPTVILMMCDGSFQNYAGGVYRSSTCTTQVNHAMLLVGFDFDTATGQWYWLVKNSWGNWWGESGYIRVAMTGDGLGACGMYQWSYKAPTSFSSVALA